MPNITNPPITTSILAYAPAFPNGIVNDVWAAWFQSITTMADTGPVLSFNGRTGVVVPANGDYSASQITGLAAFIVANGVSSFNGRQGAVVPAANDYSFAQLSGTATVAQIPNLPASQITATAGTNAIFGSSVDVVQRGLDALVQSNVKSATTTAQPGSPADGDTYLLPTSSTGAAWAGNGGKIARYSSVTSAWEFYTPQNGWETYAQDTGIYWFLVGGAWTTQLEVGNGTASTSTTTGDLVVKGGAGIGGNVNAGGDVTASAISGMTVTANTQFTGPGTGLTGTAASLTAGTATNATQLGGTAAASYALLASPTFTGTPSAPTASPGTNTTQLATTAFVATAIGGGSSSPVIFRQTEAVTVGTGSTAEASFTGAGSGSLTIGANSLVAGSNLRITAYGVFTSGSTGLVTTIRVKFGGTTMVTASLNLPINVSSAAPWRLVADITFPTIGSSGTLFAYSDFSNGSSTVAGSTGGNAGTATTVNTTVSNALDVTCQFGNSNLSNSLTCTTLVVEKL